MTLITNNESGPLPRTAVITGADSGIGRATAVRLADDGMDIGITWHTDQEGAERTAAEVRDRGRQAVVERLDLTALPAAADVVDHLADRLGRLDVLVNNAGTGTATPFLDLDHTTVQQVLDVDLVGPFLCGQCAARRMIRQGEGGRIVNITSVHESQPRVGAAPYCAAKGGLGLLTQVMALELAEHVAFLAGPDAAYVTGASWAVDGGMLRMGPMAGSHLESDDWRRG
ncbi:MULTISPECIES: SDR family NAD(P)-dependent oxidoreductase [unclassified Streptomyces]|uniref:SDR family NAD(P)-dependent oxidoreductase n=1 Tax=unclassified Streptomyces TaxID=2593676 RepID=UPI00336ACD6B